MGGHPVTPTFQPAFISYTWASRLSQNPVPEHTILASGAYNGLSGAYSTWANSKTLGSILLCFSSCGDTLSPKDRAAEPITFPRTFSSRSPKHHFCTWRCLNTAPALLSQGPDHPPAPGPVASDHPPALDPAALDHTPALCLFRIHPRPYLVVVGLAVG